MGTKLSLVTDSFIFVLHIWNKNMEYAVVVKPAKVHIHKADNYLVMLIYTIHTCTVLFRRTFPRRFHRSINQPNRYSTAQLRAFGKISK
jgi:hypothetical protein